MFLFAKNRFGWLVVWLVVSLVRWMVGWLVVWLIGWIVGYFILSRLLYLTFSANLGLICMLHPGVGPLV